MDFWLKIVLSNSSPSCLSDLPLQKSQLGFSILIEIQSWESRKTEWDSMLEVESLKHLQQPLPTLAEIHFLERYLMRIGLYNLIIPMNISLIGTRIALQSFLIFSELESFTFLPISQKSFSTERLCSMAFLTMYALRNGVNLMAIGYSFRNQ